MRTSYRLIMLFSFFFLSSSCSFLMESSILLKSTSGSSLIGPVLNAGSLNDGSTYSSLSQTPVISWSAAVSSESVNYEIGIGTAPGSTNVSDWTNVGSVLSYQFSGLNLNNTTTYYASVRAIDQSGNSSAVISGDGWSVNYQATGVLNNNFGTHWIRGTANDIWNFFLKVVVDTQGRILATGAIKNAAEWGDIVLHRLLPDGTLDTTFNGIGTININITPFEYGIGLHITSNNKIVLGGAYTTTENPFVWRFNDDGGTDSTFGAAGWRSIAVAGENYARSMAVDPGNGDYYLVGDDYGDTAYIVNFTSAGEVDNTFSGNGHFDLSTHTYAYAHDVIVDNNGKVVIVGSVKPGGIADDWATMVWRVNTNGTLDTTFNTVGYRIYDDQLTTNVDESAQGILVDSNNNYIIFGQANRGGGINDVMVMKIDASNGDPVIAFGNNGIRQIADIASLGGSSYLNEAIYDLNGKILMTGSANNGSNNDLFVIRLTADGTLDSSFNTDGILVLNSLRGYNGNDDGRSIAVAPSGIIYVGGRSESAAAQADAIIIRID